MDPQPIGENAPEPPLDHLVFAHDNKFLDAGDGRVYSMRGGWPWPRYLRIAKRLTIAARMQTLPASVDTAPFAPAYADNVTFREMPSLSHPVHRVARRNDVMSRMLDLLEDADGLVARLPSEIAGIGIKAAERLGKPWVVEVVTCTWDALWNRGGWQGKAYAPVSYLQMRSLTKRAPFAFYVTSEFLQRRYPTTGFHVGVSDVEIPEPDPDVLARRLDRVRNPGTEMSIGIMGFLDVRFKGIHVALDALARARDRLPPFRFRVLAPGDPGWHSERARRLGLDSVTSFEGTLPAGDAVLSWLDELDLYIQPSFQEGLPRSIVEAFSRAVPVLGSTAGGIPELLEPECLHEPGDAEALGRHLIRALTDDPWRARHAQRNFEKSHEFATTALEPKRDAFWDAFAEFARTGQPPERSVNTSS